MAEVSKDSNCVKLVNGNASKTAIENISKSKEFKANTLNDINVPECIKHNVQQCLVNGNDGSVEHEIDLSTKKNTFKSIQSLNRNSSNAEKVEPELSNLPKKPISITITNQSSFDKTLVAQLLNELVNGVIKKVDTKITNSLSNKKDTPLATSKTPNNVRTSKRKRVPKKLDDDEKKEPTPAPIVKKKVTLVETPILYKLGDLVWSYVPGHPLWPCMLTLDPLESICTKMQGGATKVCRAYHVQFLGDSPEHGWVRGTRVFPYRSPEDYHRIIQDLTLKSKRVTHVKVPRLEIPVRLQNDWESGVEEVIEAMDCSNEERIRKYEYDFKPHMKEFKHLYNRRSKINIYNECEQAMDEILDLVCGHTSTKSLSCANDNITLVQSNKPQCLISSSSLDNLPLCDSNYHCADFVKDFSEASNEATKTLKVQYSVDNRNANDTNTSPFTVASSNTMLPVCNEISGSTAIFAEMKKDKISCGFDVKNLLDNGKKASLESNITYVHNLCTCTAFTDKPDKKGMYTNQDLMVALEAIGSGCKLPQVCRSLNIPYSTVRDYVNGKRVLRFTHHFQCKVFSEGVSFLGSKFVTHAKASIDCEAVRLRNDIPLAPTDVVTTNNPVVVLDRNDVSAKARRNSSKSNNVLPLTSKLAESGVLRRSYKNTPNCDLVQQKVNKLTKNKSTDASTPRMNKIISRKSKSDHLVKQKSKITVKSKSFQPSQCKSSSNAQVEHLIKQSELDVLINTNTRQFEQFKSGSWYKKKSYDALIQCMNEKNSKPLDDELLFQQKSITPFKNKSYYDALIQNMNEKNSAQSRTDDRSKEDSNSQSNSKLSKKESDQNLFKFTKKQISKAWSSFQKEIRNDSSREELMLNQVFELIDEGMEIVEAAELVGVHVSHFMSLLQFYVPVPAKKIYPARLVKKKLAVSGCSRGGHLYTPVELLQAMDDVFQNKTKYSVAGSKFQIPHSTLKDYCNRNVDVYMSLVSSEMTPQTRMDVLKENILKFRSEIVKRGSSHAQPNEKRKGDAKRSKPCTTSRLQSSVELGSSQPKLNSLSRFEKFDSQDAATRSTLKQLSRAISATNTLQQSSNVCRTKPGTSVSQSSTSDSHSCSYSLAQLSYAIAEAKTSRPVSAVAIKYGIPFSTLHNKLYGRTGSKKQIKQDALLKYITQCKLEVALKILTSWGWSLSLTVIQDLIADFMSQQSDWQGSTRLSQFAVMTFCQTNNIIFESPIDETELQVDADKLLTIHSKLQVMLKTHVMRQYPNNVYLLQEYNECSDNKIQYSILAAVNATGYKYPPLTVFDADELWCSYPNSFPGAQYALAKNCHITSEIFSIWMKQFLSTVTNRPLVFVFDGNIKTLPLSLVNSIYEASCVILKLPYQTMNCSFELPYKNIIKETLRSLEVASICSSFPASTADIVASVNAFWKDKLTSPLILQSLSNSPFFNLRGNFKYSKKAKKHRSIIQRTPEQAGVEFKVPSKIILSEARGEPVAKPGALNKSLENLVVQNITSNDCSFSSKSLKLSENLSVNCLKNPKSSVKSSQSRRSSPRLNRSSIAQCSLSSLDSSSTRNASDFDLDKNVAADDSNCELSLPATSGRSSLASDLNETGFSTEFAASTCQLLSFTGSNDEQPSIAFPSPICNDSVAMKEGSTPAGSTSSSDKAVKSEVSEKSLYLSYYQKRCGPLQTEQPHLTPEEIDARITMEWELLTPARKKKYGKRPSTGTAVNESSPKKKHRKELKKDEEKKEFACSCGIRYSTKHSLSQHKRWCSGMGSTGRALKKMAKVASPVSESQPESSKLKFKCELCNDEFFSSKSLQIHKKYCTAKQLSPAKEKQIVSKKRGQSVLKLVKQPTDRQRRFLNGTVQRRSLPANTRRKKELNEEDKLSKTLPVSPVQKKITLNDETPSTAVATELGSSTPARKNRRSLLGSGVKRENVCVKCESIGEGKMLACVGGCCQSVHLDCLEGDKPKEDEPYTCFQCASQSHPCFICKIGPEKDDSELGKIKRCSVQHCGRSYHTSCLDSWKLAMFASDLDCKDGEKGDRFAMMNTYRCPIHVCATCASRFRDDQSSGFLSGNRILKCIRCPTAFHAGNDCIAAGSIILPGLNMICADHFEPLKTTPYHQPVHVSWCFICSKGGELVCCEKCPAAFHPTCVGMDKPPDGEWFCRDCRHRRRLLYGDIVWVKLGSYRWWPGEITHPHDIPDNIRNLRHDVGEFVVNFFGSKDYFWLNQRRVFLYQEGDTGASSAHCSRGISSVFNKALRDASQKFEELSRKRQKIQDTKVQKKRPQYKFIKINKPVGSVQVYTADLSEIPRCICKRTDPNPCGPDSECLNRMLMFECHPVLCPAGDKCQNRHFQKRDYPQSEVFKTSWGGWGLKAAENVKKGQFVNEYVGELVDNEECMRRIELAHKNNVTNFYMLTIDKDRIIDAGPKGNFSRFMNHSCDPCCETQKWTVNGDTRVGLFARRDIKPGEELTFNYNLDCLGNDKTPCRCEAKNCSGFIGVRPKPQLEALKSLDQKVKKKRRRADQRDMPKHDDFCFRCRQVGTLVCCDVRGCQRAFCLSCLRLTKPPFGKWECPWHHCDFCGRRAQSFCHFCPNSFCASHVMNQLTLSVPNQYDCCTDHDPNVAEYEMEEAIAAVVASMLPPENWEVESEELKPSKEIEEIKVENCDETQKKKKIEEKTREKRRKRSLSKKRTSVAKEPERKEAPSPVLPPPASPSSQEESILTESDVELGPPTSSPVRRKRAKRQYFRGTKKRRNKPRALNISVKSEDEKNVAEAKSEETSKPEVKAEGSVGTK